MNGNVFGCKITVQEVNIILGNVIDRRKYTLKLYTRIVLFHYEKCKTGDGNKRNSLNIRIIIIGIQYNRKNVHNEHEELAFRFTHVNK